MTGKADFTQEEWELVQDGPAIGGIFAATASSGGSFRESWALAKSYAEAQKQPGESELLDALVAERPPVKRYGSQEELEQEGLGRLREAVALVEQKAAPEEVEAYRGFVVEVAQKVAQAHKEEGTAVSDEERAAIDKLSEVLRPA
jgi:hypothetical protein